MDKVSLREQPLGSHFVDGQYIEAPSGELMDIIYPATMETIAQVRSANRQIVDDAVNAARSAQQEWAKLRPVERGRVLRNAAEIMRRRNQELSELETLNTGKPLQETLVADATTGAECLEYFGGLAGSLTSDYIDLGTDFAYTLREPLGVCLGIGAWNYPMQIACWKAAPALACGNAMVFKPSEITPLTALKLAEIFMEAGCPPGLFNVVIGAGDVGQMLVNHPGIDKVSLTGSVPTGKKVAAAAAGHMKHVTMELGGKSPVLIFADCDMDQAVEGAIGANFFATGQVCSNGTRVFVQKEIYEEFLTRVLQATDKIRIGDPLNEATEMGPLVSMNQLQIVNKYIALGCEQGARKLTTDRDLPEVGAWISPTIFADVTDDMVIAKEEIFGPVMSVLPFETEEEVINRANNTHLGLSAGVFSKNLERAHRVVKNLQAGSCWINTYNLTPVEVPFGGVKQSGVGRENARSAINSYSQLKSVYVAGG